MVQLHVLLACVLTGLCCVDLGFDTLILTDYNAPMEKVKQIQAFYGRTRNTYIVQVITVMLGLLGLSLGRAVIFRRERRDVAALLAMLALLPYYVLFMEPAEDACIGANAHKLSEAELRHGFFLIGIGHIATIIVASGIALLEMEWSLHKRLAAKKNA